MLHSLSKTNSQHQIAREEERKKGSQGGKDSARQQLNRRKSLRKKSGSRRGRGGEDIGGGRPSVSRTRRWPGRRALQRQPHEASRKLHPTKRIFFQRDRSMASSSAPLSSGSVITVVSSAAVGASSGSTGSPCAACKFLRRKCQPDCVFAPYFPPDNPQKFVHVHRVFGASNVTKLLNELHPYQREDAVNSLAYEADMRLRDPVYGCVGVISILQHQLRQLQQDLTGARYELSKYQAAAAAAASASVGSNGPPSMADFIGNAVPNCTQNFINISHSTAAAIGSVSGRTGFGHDQFAAVQMLARSYEGESTVARLGVNGGGGYDFGYSSAMGAGPVSGLGPFGGRPFFKPGTAGGDERPTAAQ